MLVFEADATHHETNQCSGAVLAELVGAFHLDEVRFSTFSGALVAYIGARAGRRAESDREPNVTIYVLTSAKEGRKIKIEVDVGSDSSMYLESEN
jgi:hypothetical protein